MVEEAGRPLIECQAVSFRIGKATLIDNIDLTLGTTAITAVMGPCGAGKSILLRLLHGLLQPTAGRIMWSGIWDASDMNAELRRVQAMVFQRPVMLRRSVAANIRHSLIPLNLPARDVAQRQREALKLAGLERQAATSAPRLGPADQQRLAIARALARKPAILFLDEPTAGLDPAAVASVEAVVRQAVAAGTKVVMATQDFGQAQRLADDVVFLHHGVITEHTPAGDFFGEPRSEPARDYLTGRLVI